MAKKAKPNTTKRSMKTAGAAISTSQHHHYRRRPFE